MSMKESKKGCDKVATNGTTNWRRPCDMATWTTFEPKDMLGKYLTSDVVNNYTDDYVDEDGNVVSVERHNVIKKRGEIDQEKLQEIMFAIQAGDISYVEVSDEDVREMTLDTPEWFTTYLVEMRWFSDGRNMKERFAVRARTIQQAIQIAAEFGQMYRGFEGRIRATRVTQLNVNIVPDDDMCIPVEDRTPEYVRKDYFKVQVRTVYWEIDHEKQYDSFYVVAAKDVGQAKERIQLMFDIREAEAKANHDNSVDDVRSRTVRKAMPFEVDCIVPIQYSKLYR